jgi:DNA-binding transcriptional LysR family regulator
LACCFGRTACTIDLVISIGNAFKGFHRQLLYTDSDALAVRRGHPVGTKLKRRETFIAARHVAVIIRGQAEDSSTPGYAQRASSGTLRWSYQGISRRCMSLPAPTSSLSCPGG